jgi:hypothetical protein
MTPKIRNSEVRTDVIARQRLCKHIPAVTNTQTTTEYLPLLYNGAVNALPKNTEAVFSAWSVQSGHKEEFRK